MSPPRANAAGLAERVDRIDEQLPQIQCQRCGYSGCRPYAEAIARGEANINRCPPGGSATIAGLARLLGVSEVPLDEACGGEQPLGVARIVEDRCIGCTKCIQACPVDAILGAPKQMHTVLAGLCTGCGLCVPPCPVDCIEMLPPGRGWDQAQANGARGRFAARQARLAGELGAGGSRWAAGEASGLRAKPEAEAERRALIRAAVERTRSKRAAARRHCP